MLTCYTCSVGRPLDEVLGVFSRIQIEGRGIRRSTRPPGAIYRERNSSRDPLRNFHFQPLPFGVALCAISLRSQPRITPAHYSSRALRLPIALPRCSMKGCLR
jgi:hypothetical protein